MSAIRLDMTRWPIVVVVPPDKVTDAELHTFMDEFDNSVRVRRERFVMVLDLRRSSGMLPKQRKMLTDHLNQQPEANLALCQGNALVFESALLRTMLTAILWVRRSTHPVQVFASVDEACNWGRDQMSRAMAHGTP